MVICEIAGKIPRRLSKGCSLSSHNLIENLLIFPAHSKFDIFKNKQTNKNSLGETANSTFGCVLPVFKTTQLVEFLVKLCW